MNNKIFNLWKVVDDKRIKITAYWYVRCVCKCGTERMVRIQNLNSGKSKSCGCIGRGKTIKRNTIHNKRFDKIWGIWQAMKNRCYNKNMVQYKNWGGRGITVCDEWKNSFVAFYKAVGDPPRGKSLDRINNNGNYELGNVKWSTAKEQMRNKSNNRKINGICISDISKELGGADSLVGKRLKRGWSIENAISIKSNAQL